MTIAAKYFIRPRIEVSLTALEFRMLISPQQMTDCGATSLSAAALHVNGVIALAAIFSAYPATFSPTSHFQSISVGSFVSLGRANTRVQECSLISSDVCVL